MIKEAAIHSTCPIPTELSRKYPSLDSVHKKISSMAHRLLQYHQDFLQILRYHQVIERKQTVPITKNGNKVVQSSDANAMSQHSLDQCENLFVSEILMPFHDKCMLIFGNFTKQFKLGRQLKSEEINSILEEELPPILRSLEKLPESEVEMLIYLSRGPTIPRIIGRGRLVFKKEAAPIFRHRPLNMEIPADKNTSNVPIPITSCMPDRFEFKEYDYVIDGTEEDVIAKHKELWNTCTNANYFIYEEPSKKLKMFLVADYVFQSAKITHSTERRTHQIICFCKGSLFSPVPDPKAEQAYRFAHRKDHFIKTIEFHKKKFAKLQNLIQLYQTYLTREKAVSQTSSTDHLSQLANLLDTLNGTTLGRKKIEVTYEPLDTKPDQPTPLAETQPSKSPTGSPTRSFLLAPKMYEIFTALMKPSAKKISWSEAVSCLSKLGFSVTPVSGSIYKFSFDNVSAFIPEETDAEYSDRVCKNLHQPHDKGQNEKTPLNPTRLKRFRELIESAGMTLDTVTLTVERA